MDHLAILNVTSIITALLWLTVPCHWQTCRLLLACTNCKEPLGFSYNAWQQRRNFYGNKKIYLHYSTGHLNTVVVVFFRWLRKVIYKEWQQRFHCGRLSLHYKHLCADILHPLIYIGLPSWDWLTPVCWQLQIDRHKTETNHDRPHQNLKKKKNLLRNCTCYGKFNWCVSSIYLRFTELKIMD